MEGGRGVPILQSLVLDHLLLHAGPAFWVDANGHATTTTLSQIAPSRRLLDRIHVARGFLPPTASTTGSPDGGESVSKNRRPTIVFEIDNLRRMMNRHTPSLIVAPRPSSRYRADPPSGNTRKRFRPERSPGWRPTPTCDIPVLSHRTKRNDFTASGVTAADHHLECEQTRMGPRVVGGFETLVYPVDDGAYY